MAISRRIPVKGTQDEITISVRQLLVDGAVLSEIMAVLRENCFAPKGLVVIQRYDLWEVHTYKEGNHKKIYSSPSLAPCVEFALRYEVSHD